MSGEAVIPHGEGDVAELALAPDALHHGEARAVEILLIEDGGVRHRAV